MFLNANAPIPFSGSLGSSTYPYVYYNDQSVTSQHSGVTVASDVYGARVLPGATSPAPLQLTSAATWSHSNPASSAIAWQSQPVPPGHAMISANPDSTAQTTQKDVYTQRIRDLESELHLARAQCEEQQQEGRTVRAQVESLTSELTAERQRSDELGRQLMALSAAHHALQVEHQRLLGQHAAIVREHEHMTSAQAAALRELEARHADVSRLQRLLDEAQAAVTAASMEASSRTGPQQTPHGGGSARSSIHSIRASTTPPRRVSGHSALHLSTADEERWTLRLQKAERALEEERRVSEDLRQQLKVAEAEWRAVQKKMKQLENGPESPSGAAMPPANSDPLPKTPRVLSPLSLIPPNLGATSSGVLTGSGSMSLPALAGGQPPSAGAMLGRAASAGSGVGQVQAAGAKLVTFGSAFASGPPGTMSAGGGGTSGTAQPAHAHEEQVAQLKKEVDGLRSDLTRLAATEEMHRVAVRAAEDRARAAESVSLDARKQCDQAARTIGRLIDENCELVTKLNYQANALADSKKSTASKEAMLRGLEARLAQAQAQLAAAQAQANKAGDNTPQQQEQIQEQAQEHRHSKGPVATPQGPGFEAAETYGVVSQSQSAETGRPGTSNGVLLGREVLLPGGALTEADWKLVMLAEEVRRLVGEVSLSATACTALQLKRQCELSSQEQRHQHQGVGPKVDLSSTDPAAVAAPGEPQALSLDLPLILSRLEGLAGRRLGPGETAAYILELAGHMEALEQVLQTQKRRMEALRLQEQEEMSMEPGPREPATGLKEGRANVGDGRGLGADTMHSANRTLIRSAEQRQQQQAPAHAYPVQSEEAQAAESRNEVPQPLGQVHVQTGGQEATVAVRYAVGAGPLDARDSAAAFATEASSEEANSSRVLIRGTALGNFVENGTSNALYGGNGSLQPQSSQHPHPPPASLQSPVQAPPIIHHHIVSPFNNLVQRKDSCVAQMPPPHQPEIKQLNNAARQEQQLSQELPITTLDTGIDFRNTQRGELAAAAAAAVAAATAAAATEADGMASSAAASTTPVTVPMGLQPYQAPASPRAAPVAAAMDPPAPVVAVTTDMDVSGCDALLEEELLDEAAASRVKPRRARVGLWGWISGESAR